MKTGSSPLTRGKPTLSNLTSSLTRLIPAHAGKTWLTCRVRFAGWAHPRSRGENNRPHVSEHVHQGSSPLTRGKRNDAIDRGAQEGLIPAHAGKTPGHADTRQCAWAHPRSRGENATARSRCPPPKGSSPLTRGKPGRYGGLAGGDGLIPAHAGKTVATTMGSPASRAHPRSRGENVAATNCPPLTTWLIPAHAGKTGGA